MVLDPKITKRVKQIESIYYKIYTRRMSKTSTVALDKLRLPARLAVAISAFCSAVD